MADIDLQVVTSELNCDLGVLCNGPYNVLVGRIQFCREALDHVLLRTFAIRGEDKLHWH